MKKVLKVILYFLGSILLLLLLVLIFRNPIISYSIKTVIDSKSEGKVTLQIKDFDLNLLEGSILIEEPELVMQEIYLDESKNMSIDRIVFNKIEIDFLDLGMLISKRNISAKRFLINKPQFYFTELGTNKKSSFHPDKLFEALNHNPGVFKTLQVQIGDIEIHYGSINISEYTSPEVDPGIVDFTIMLHDFNTVSAKDSTQQRILFSEELLFKLKNLNRKLKSGYTLSIDSAVFSTKKRDLEIGGVAFTPGRENLEKNTVDLYAGQLVITDVGLEEVRGLEDLSIGDIHLSDGYFTTYRNGQAEKKSEADTTSKLESIEKLFYEFLIDSVTITNFEYYNIETGTDTTIAADDINFMITGIEIDSGMFEDPFRNFLYDSIKLSTGNFELNKVIPGMDLKYNSLSYSNKNMNLKVAGIILSNDSTANLPDKIDVALGELDIKGFSLKRFQKQQTQRISVMLNDPEINLDLAQLGSHQKTNNGKPIVPKHLQLEKIILNNGNINLKVENQLEIALKGLNIDVEEFYFPDKIDTNYRFENLTFSYDKLVAQIENKKYQFVTGNLNYQDQELLLKNINGSLLIGTSGQPVQFGTKYLVLNEFDLDRLLFENELHLSALQLGEPVVSGTFQIPRKEDTVASSDDSKKKGIPLKINIGGIAFKRGKVDAVINLKGEQINLVTGYNIKIGAISANKGETLNSLIEQLLWDIEFNKTKFDYKDHEVYFKSLITNSFSSEFRIDSLSVISKLNPEDQPHKMKVSKLSLPQFDVTGLDYQLLVMKDSIKFGTAKIKGVGLDLVLPKTSEPNPVDPNHKIDLRKYLVFSYDTISLTKLELNVEQPGDSSHTVFGLEDFSFNHYNKVSTGLNLVNNFGFEFETFSYRDTITGKFLTINKGYVDSERAEITIEGIEGSNLVRKHGRMPDKSKPNIGFKSSQIKFQNVFIKEELPSEINVGQIYIGDLALNYQKAEITREKTSFKLDLDILKRFSKIMSRLQVDTTVLNDISVSYQGQKDTASNIFKMDSVALIVNQIAIDTTMVGQSDPQLIKKLTVDLRGRAHITKDSLYEIRTGRLHYDFPKHQIIVDSLYVIPRYVDSVFFEKAVYQTGRLNLFGRKIEVNDIDVDALLYKDYIHFGSVDLHEFAIKIFKNKRYEIKPGTYKPLPREALMSIKQKFTVDSVHFINSRLDYKQIEEKSVHPGEIFLDDFNVTAYNITNMLKEDDHQSMLKVDLDTKIMGEARMRLKLLFPLYPDSTSFWLTGKVEDLDMVQLNSMTENLMGIGIINGKASIDIPLMSANDSIVTGSLVFRYKKLKLALYNRKKEEINASFFSPVINFLINDLVLRSNNPRFARKPKTGLIYFKRDTRKGIVNFAFRGLLSGMLYTVGINSKGQRKEKKDLKRAP